MCVFRNKAFFTLFIMWHIGTKPVSNMRISSIYYSLCAKTGMVLFLSSFFFSDRKKCYNTLEKELPI